MAAFVKMSVRASFKTFRPRFQVNADKLEMVFEVDWNHLPAGFMDLCQNGAKGFGELTWEQTAAAAKQGDKGETDPTQMTLPGMVDEKHPKKDRVRKSREIG